MNFKDKADIFISEWIVNSVDWIPNIDDGCIKRLMCIDNDEVRFMMNALVHFCYILTESEKVEFMLKYGRMPISLQTVNKLYGRSIDTSKYPNYSKQLEILNSYRKGKLSYDYTIKLLSELGYEFK